MKTVVTKVIMALALVAVIGWDLYVFLTPPDGDTISELLATWAPKWPSLPFAAGVVVGHLFWPVTSIPHKVARLWTLAVVCGGMLLADILWLDNVLAILPVLAGVVVGRILWPMVRPQSSV